MQNKGATLCRLNVTEVFCKVATLQVVPELCILVPMAFNLKDERAVESLRELARLEGISMSAAMSTAIELRLSQLRRHGQASRILELAEEIRSQPEFELRTNEVSDAEMYDEFGLPR